MRESRLYWIWWKGERRSTDYTGSPARIVLSKPNQPSAGYRHQLSQLETQLQLLATTKNMSYNNNPSLPPRTPASLPPNRSVIPPLSLPDSPLFHCSKWRMSIADNLQPYLGGCNCSDHWLEGLNLLVRLSLPFRLSRLDANEERWQLIYLWIIVLAAGTTTLSLHFQPVCCCCSILLSPFPR